MLDINVSRLRIMRYLYRRSPGNLDLQIYSGGPISIPNLFI